MFNRHFLATATAIACATALTSAQTPATGGAPQVPPAAQSSRPSPQATTTDRAPERSSMTMTGCLVREQDVPGHAPNDTYRVGRMEDYVLTSASSSRPDAAKPPAATSGAVGTSGSTAPATAHNVTMFKIDGVSDMQLKSLVGKRVEVVGLMRNDDMKHSNPAATAAKTPAIGSGSATQTGTEANAGRGEEKTPWAHFAASSIREIPGSCAAASSNR